MADVQVAIWLWWEPGDDFAACGSQMLGQLLSRVAQVPLPAIAEVHCGQDLHGIDASRYVPDRAQSAAVECCPDLLCYVQLLAG